MTPSQTQRRRPSLVQKTSVIVSLHAPAQRAGRHPQYSRTPRRVTRAKLKTLDKDYVFVLNQCPALQDSQRVQDGAKALEVMGGLLTPLIASRVDYQQAAREGMGVTEINPNGKAADEIRRLWLSLKRRLAKVKPVAKQVQQVA